MRYYTAGSSLFIRGSFQAVSTGPHGGLSGVECLSCHTISPESGGSDQYRQAELLLMKEGLFPGACFPLMTRSPMTGLCIFRYDPVTCFITAGLPQQDGPGYGITVIVTCDEGLFPEALAGAVVTVTEAKSEALFKAGHPVFGTPSDAVIIASEGGPVHRSTGAETDIGKRMKEAVRYGTRIALERHEGSRSRSKESFFVYSTIGGGHWAEWVRESCPYYPCHHEGQCCDFCYCPLYPCNDPSLGSLVTSTSGGTIWNCSGCGLVHDPLVAGHLKNNPMATLAELKAVFDRAGMSGVPGQASPE